MKILGMGNALVDMMIRIEHEQVFDEFGLLKGGMRLVDAAIIDRLLARLKPLPVEIATGGSAANTMYGLGKLGIETSFIGKVAADDMGKFMTEDMLKSRIQPRLLQGIEPTGIALALVTPDSERTFAVNLGCAIELSPEDIDAEMFEGYDIFHIEGYLVQNKELLDKALHLAKEAGAKVSFDLASFDVVEENLAYLKSIIARYVDILFANEDEARAFSGLGPEKALMEISKTVPVTIIKTGDKGSLISDGNQIYKIGVIPATSIDTTGAGDLYAAGFLYGLVKALPMEICGKIGALLAGKVIGVLGAKMKDDTWEEIKIELNKLV